MATSSARFEKLLPSILNRIATAYRMGSKILCGDKTRPRLVFNVSDAIAMLERTL
ncbi:MAG: hypothetical protein ACPGC9_01960 [Cytophagales bacterium]